MTIWDNIYKNYQKGGLAWATLDSNDVDQEFKEFLKNKDLATKNVLDIGCGTGKYLSFLKKLGFRVSGIDSSETSIQMTNELLENDVDAKLANMFDYEIEPNKFDLIISVATIHHGLKKDVNRLINLIDKSLISGGWIFITIPSLESRLKWNTFQEDKEIGPGTFAPQTGPEKGLPHSFYSLKEIEEMFSNFQNIKIDLDKKGRWIIEGQKCFT